MKFCIPGMMNAGFKYFHLGHPLIEVLLYYIPCKLLANASVLYYVMVANFILILMMVHLIVRTFF